MKLRNWQHECSGQAVDHYEFSSHFFCLATPGAGKTVLAAEIAKVLLHNDKIDFVLCFSPSTEVVNGVRKTFSTHLNVKFNGKLGDVGDSLTYHKLRFLDDDFWSLLESNRVLVIMDEIHHCAGDSIDNANAWGEEILLRVQDKATYTLALSGTPWRSDKLPIVLSKYADEDAHIICNYVYGMQQAVLDRVCCVPQIVLVDNDVIGVKRADTSTETFTSFQSLFENTELRYTDVITHEQVMLYTLTAAHNKLIELRKTAANSAGVVVASSVEHANVLQALLKEKLNATAVIVNYTMPDSSAVIEQFRTSDDQWIVSVGMVSEGTDIPRLKVCCYLSDVKTELYFRQVLGRIIRVTSSNLQHAWLYALNEHTLAKFAQRINDDLPEHEVVSRAIKNIDLPKSSNVEIDSEPKQTAEMQYSNLDEIITFLESDSSLSLSEIEMFDIMLMPQEKRLPTNQLSVSKHFREKIFNMFVSQ